MVKHKEIQTLINEIDNVLPRASSDEPRRLHPEDIARQHRVLERVHSYLVSLLKQPESRSPASTESLNPTEQETAWRIAQAAIAQMQQHFPDAPQAIQQEVKSLSQQRDSLRQEIQQLRNQQQQLLSNFLQELSSRLSTSLPNPVKGDSSATRSASEQLSNSLIESQHLEQLQHQSEQRLRNLDATFQAVFEALEGDLQSYQNSLSQGLEQMHSLGRQGEALFSAYFQRMLSQSPNSQALNSPEQNLSEESSAFGGNNQETTTGESVSNIASPLETLPLAETELANRNVEGLTSEETPQPPEEATIERLMNLDLEGSVTETSAPLNEENVEGYERLFTEETSDAVPVSDLPLNEESVEGYERLFTEEEPTPSLFENSFSTTTPETEVQMVETENRVEEESKTDSESWNIEETLFGKIANSEESVKTNSLERPLSENIVSESESRLPDESEEVSTESKDNNLPQNTGLANEPSAPETETVETIYQLTDLLTEIGWNEESDSVIETPEEALESEFKEEEEDYHSVAHGENLLTEQPFTRSPEPELEEFLDSETLQQLSEDLEDFEEAEKQQPPTNLEEENKVSVEPWKDLELPENLEESNPEENEMQSESSSEVSFFVEEIGTSPWSQSSASPENEGDVTSEEENN